MARHHTAVFAALPIAGARLVREDGAKADVFCPLAWPATARLASRAALISSGVLRSGSEDPARSRARETWRLCRLANRLSIFLPYACGALHPDPGGLAGFA